MSDNIHPNLKLTSHSGLTTLHKCPRKFEIDKMLGEGPQERDPHLDFGHLVGAGAQELLLTGSLNRAYFKMFQLWRHDLDDEEGKKDKKTFWWALPAIDRFFTFRHTALSGYELVHINDIPALELGFKIDCGNGFFYRGFIDALLIHTATQTLVPLELKTTKNREPNEATYKNSGQALGYSVILDSVAPLLGINIRNSFRVLYPVWSTSKQEWDMFPFTKDFSDRASWIRSLLYDIEDITRWATQEFFPMRGESCYDFFRQCEHLDTCTMSNKFLFAGVKEKIEKEGRYQFQLSLADIIDRQLKRQGEAT